MAFQAKTTNTVGRQQGLSLVELMVSVAISAFILAGVMQMYATSRNNAYTSDGTNRIQENIRYAFSILERDALQTGNMGCFSLTYKNEPEDIANSGGVGEQKTSQAKRYNTRGDILSIDDGRNGIDGERYDLNRMIYGSNDDGGNDSDTVIFRYAPTHGAIPVRRYLTDAADITLDLDLAFNRKKFEQIEQFDVLLVADCTSALYFMVTNEPDVAEGILRFATGIAAPLDHPVNPGQSNNQGLGLYDKTIVNPNTPDQYAREVRLQQFEEDENNAVRPYVYVGRAAYKYTIGLSAGGASVGGLCESDTPQYCALFRDDEEIAEGVHDLQIEYGWQSGGSGLGNVSFGDASEVPPGTWDYVDRLRVTISFNSVDKVRQADGDALATKTLTRTISLRNQISDN